MNLGELIEALKGIDPERVVAVGIGRPHSYRMDYAQLAFEPVVNTSIGSMLAAAESAMGTTYEGWKGGDYTMYADTTVNLAMTGDPGCELHGVLLDILTGALDPRVQRDEAVAAMNASIESAESTADVMRAMEKCLAKLKEIDG